MDKVIRSSKRRALIERMEQILKDRQEETRQQINREFDLDSSKLKARR